MFFMRQCIATIFLLLPLVANAQEEPPQPTAISIGPYRTGMSLTELRAAAPEVEWVEAKSIMSPYKKLLKAEKALELIGMQYDIQVTPGWYGEYQLVVHHRSEVENDEACASRTEQLITDLEKRYGTFTATNAPYDKLSPLVTRQRPTATKNRKVGSSEYTWHQNASYSEATSLRHKGNAEITVFGQYHVDSFAFGESTCVSQFKIAVKGNPPQFEEVPFKNLKATLSPSIAVLHETIAGLELPATGLTVSARCSLSRESGLVGTCSVDPSVSIDIAAAINRRGDHMAFDPAQLDPGNPVKSYTHINFHFARAQRLSVGTPVDPMNGSEVDWHSELDAVPIQSVIAAPSRNNYDSATAVATCQIQSDGSLVCIDYKVTPLNDATLDTRITALFEADARSRLKYRRAALKSKNGSATAGKWVKIEMAVRVIRARAN
jgi:hypothetical protein